MVTMNRNKVVIVGTGQVGSTAAFAIVTHGLCNELVLIDHSAGKALGESHDLDDGSEFQDRHVKVRNGDYGDCKDADIVVITVGRKPPANSTRLDELGFTIGLVGDVVDRVMASGFNGVIVMVSNPVDVMAWYAWKRSGLPRTQVLGTGTALDTSRLKTIIGEETGLDPRNVGGFVMGEHGDSELAVWSSANISGADLDDYCRIAGITKPADELSRIYEHVRDAAYQIIDSKGATYYGIGMAVRRIAEAIVRNEHSVLPVTSMIYGHYGVDGICLGVPTIVGRNGAEAVLDMPLSEEELAQLQRSANTMREMIDKLDG